MRSLSSTLLILIVSSCTITKRQYTSGYHIEWKTKNHQPVSNRFVSEERNADREDNSISHSKSNAFEDELDNELSQKNSEFNTPAIQGLRVAETKVAKYYKTTKRTKESLLHKLNTKYKINAKKLKKPYGEIYLRTPREYLIRALFAFLIGALIVGICVLLIVVVEVEGLSVGGIFVYLFLIAGAVCLISVPIFLLLALASYLFGY
ncbi:MAG: hypothetical protein ACK50Y_02870 [Flavobacteriia bacterium]